MHANVNCYKKWHYSVSVIEINKLVNKLLSLAYVVGINTAYDLCRKITDYVSRKFLVELIVKFTLVE